MREYNKIVCICTVSISAILFAQAPDTVWTKTYGGVNNDYSTCVQQTTDSGYIILGYTYSFGGEPGYCDVYLIKTDSLGDTLWTGTYGEPSYDIGESVQQTTDGGYIVSGGTHDPVSPDVYAYLFKTDSLGDTIWTKIHNWGYNSSGNSVKQTSDGGYIICGTADLNAHLVKTDSLGNIIWGRSYGGDSYDEGRSLQIDTTDEYVFTGFTHSFGSGGFDLYLVKTAPWGDTLWTRTYGGSQDECGYSVQITEDGGYIITGYTNSFGLGVQILLIKTDAIGDTTWVRTYGGSGEDIGLSLLITTDGSYVIVGTTNSYGAGSRDVYLIKVDSLGNLLWETTFGETEYDVGVSIKETFDGGYIIAGYTNSYGAGSSDLWLLKIAPEVGIEERTVFIETKMVTTTIFTGSLTLSDDKPYTIFDITGRQIHTLDPAPGIYFIEVDGEIRQKIIKIR